MTGTDEHGQKVSEAAAKAGMQPQPFVDSHIDSFKDMWHKYGIMYDHFGRTTDESHVKAVQHILQKLIESGDVHKGSYEGYYCVPCETYVTEPIQGDQFAETPLCLPAIGKRNLFQKSLTSFGYLAIKIAYCSCIKIVPILSNQQSVCMKLSALWNQG